MSERRIEGIYWEHVLPDSRQFIVFADADDPHGILHFAVFPAANEPGDTSNADIDVTLPVHQVRRLHDEIVRWATLGYTEDTMTLTGSSGGALTLTDVDYHQPVELILTPAGNTGPAGKLSFTEDTAFGFGRCVTAWMLDTAGF